MLVLIKLIHSLIWLVMASAVFFILYAGITNRIGTLVWIAVGLILLEGVILAVNRITCPLTNVARKYSDSPKDNFDIFLPNLIARHNKLIFTILFIVGLLLVAARLIW